MFDTRILYYVSGHGFGHLTRSAAVIEYMVKKWPRLKVDVKVSQGHVFFAEELLKKYLGTAVRVLTFDSAFSIAFNQKEMAIDKEQTKNNMSIWLAGLEARARQEKNSVLAKYDLVISDIVPEAFAVAEKLRVPSIALANFTWYEILREYFSEGELAGLLAMYEKAGLMIEYNLSTESALPFHTKVPVGHVMRQIDTEKSASIRRKYKKEGRPLLYASFGGDLRLDKLNLSDDADYLHTFSVGKNSGANFHAIPKDTWDTQNYLAAADGVISKCGWSTISEAIIMKKPLFIFRSANGGWVEEKYILKRLLAVDIIEVTTPDKFAAWSGEDIAGLLGRMNFAYGKLSGRYRDDIGNIVDIIVAVMR